MNGSRLAGSEHCLSSSPYPPPTSTPAPCCALYSERRRGKGRSRVELPYILSRPRDISFIATSRSPPPVSPYLSRFSIGHALLARDLNNVFLSSAPLPRFYVRRSAVKKTSRTRASHPRSRAVNLAITRQSGCCNRSVKKEEKGSARARIERYLLLKILELVDTFERAYASTISRNQFA